MKTANTQTLPQLERPAKVYRIAFPRRVREYRISRPVEIIQPAEDYLTRDETAELLRVHPKTLRRMELDGELLPVRRAGLLRWRRSDIDRFMSEAVG